VNRFWAIAALTVVVTSGIALRARQPQPAPFDLAILNARLIDGTGAPSRVADVGVRNGRIAITDGPFAETKEQLGGYFIVDVEDLDTAIALAAELPGAQTGAIEVRPLIGM